MSEANKIQHGGGHYKNKAIEPWDYVGANGLGYFEGCAIKYLTRWREKGGVQDLKKAIHYTQKLIEIESGQHPVWSPGEPKVSVGLDGDLVPYPTTINLDQRPKSVREDEDANRHAFELNYVRDRHWNGGPGDHPVTFARYPDGVYAQDYIEKAWQAWRRKFVTIAFEPRIKTGVGVGPGIPNPDVVDNLIHAKPPWGPEPAKPAKKISPSAEAMHTAFRDYCLWRAGERRKAEGKRRDDLRKAFESDWGKFIPMDRDPNGKYKSPSVAVRWESYLRDNL